ncbi:CGNR zinc finger domain-containing protein [Streptomyces sp. NPDC088387]|uniref:CGNR zinc finger domain-containing protein n=1 Tax=Streptomyces sp. NPDC088387 TaxID=3365859 RepID=UPI0037F7977E
MTQTRWPATERYGLDPAPGALALVQDFLNTIATGRQSADLLADLSSAQTWVEAVAESWSRTTGAPKLRISLDEASRGRLHEHRRLLQNAAAATPPESGNALVAPVITAEISLDMHGDGLVLARPGGSGAQPIISALLITVWQAQLDETWHRLKTCRNMDCLIAFYDRSRNNSGAWHDVKTCGNAANLRAFRARKRAANGISPS